MFRIKGSNLQKLIQEKKMGFLMQVKLLIAAVRAGLNPTEARAH